MKETKKIRKCAFIVNIEEGWQPPNKKSYGVHAPVANKVKIV